MKNLKKLKIALGVGLLSTLWMVQAKAQTALPYVGPNQTNCKVNIPQDDEFMAIDAGYFTSEDCDTIYVLPPIEGELKMSEPFVSESDLILCPLVNRLRRGVGNNLDIIEESADLKEAARLLSLNRQLLDQIADLSDGSTVAMTSAGAFLRWGSLVNAYANINQNKKVVRMPLAVGLFSGNVVDLEKFDGNVVLEQEKNPLIKRLSVHGLELPDFDNSSLSSPLPDYVASIISRRQRPVLMGEAVSMTMELGHKGACALYGKRLGGKKESAAFAGTYTYFYPVQTNASVEVTISSEDFIESVVTLIDKKGANLTTNDIANHFDQQSKPLLRIDITDGGFPATDEGQKLANEYLETLKKTVISTFLARAEALAHKAMSRSTYTQVYKRKTRRCKTKWFGLSRSCRTRVYYIEENNVDTTQMSEFLTDLENQFTTEGSANKYRSIYLPGTSAFISTERGL